MSLADSIRHTASMVRWVSVTVTATNQTTYSRRCKAIGYWLLAIGYWLLAIGKARPGKTDMNAPLRRVAESLLDKHLAITACYSGVL